MNIRDSYKHGADGLGVVKNIFFATAEDVASDSSLHVNDLVFQRADTFETKVPLPIPTLNQNTTGYASSLLTVKSTSTSNHYLTFVDSNNTTAEAESFYTSGDIYFKPSTGVLTVKSVTVSNTFNYSGIGSDTTSNAARKIWFASSSDGTPVVSDNFKYNPSTKTLTVDKISGPTIVIGNTTLYLDGANNVLTPDTVINNTSTNNTIPSSKAVWDAILTGMQANDAMRFMGFLEGSTNATGDGATYTPGANKGDTYKVSKAGYINETWYQLNDTFICTEDETNAATHSNLSTEGAKWGVVEGNGDFLSIHGGTIEGTLKWKNSTALPSKDTFDYALIVDNNTTKYITKANLRSQIASGMYWADQAVSTQSLTTTEPQFAKVGIAGAKDSTAKLKVYGNEIVTGNLTIGGCTLVYESSCLKFTF